MVKKQIFLFLVRWIVSSFAMWVCIGSFGAVTVGIDTRWIYITAGLIFALINTIIRPVITLLALPLIFLTMGLFVFIINAVMVGFTIWLLPDVTISPEGAIFSCIIISVINYLANLAIPSYNKR